MARAPWRGANFEDRAAGEVGSFGLVEYFEVEARLRGAMSLWFTPGQFKFFVFTHEFRGGFCVGWINPLSAATLFEFLAATAGARVVAANLGFGVANGCCWRWQGEHRGNRDGLSRLHSGDLSQIMLNHKKAHGLLVAGVHPGLFSRHDEGFGRPPIAFILRCADDL